MRDGGSTSRRTAAARAVAGGRRYLDKNPRNSLRVPYLRALFPDGRFVFVRREGRAAVASLMSGSRSGDPRFPPVDPAGTVTLADGSELGWRFLAPPGWRAFLSARGLADVCAFQWISANEAILAAGASDDSARWVDVRYEDLVGDPEGVVRNLLGALGLPRDDATLERARTLHRRPSRATLSPPDPGKWQQHAEEISGPRDDAPHDAPPGGTRRRSEGPAGRTD